MAKLEDITRGAATKGVLPDGLVTAVDGEDAVPKYLRCPFHREPDFGVTSVNYEIRKLLEAGQIVG